MSLAQLGLGFTFSARDLASGTMARVERSFQTLDQRAGMAQQHMGSAVAGIRTELASIAGGALAGLGLSKLTSVAGDFEEQMRSVAAVGHLTREQLDALTGTAIEAGLATQFSPTEAAVGLQELAQAGRTFQQQNQMLVPILDLAAGSLGRLSVSGATGLAQQALSAFGLEADQTASVVDRLVQSVNAFQLNADDLPLALGTAANGARLLHQNLDETLISLGLIRETIPSIERGSTAVSVAMQRLTDPRVQRGLKGIGVSVADSQGHFRNFLDIVADLQPKLATMSEVKQASFLRGLFGSEGLAGVQAILAKLESGMSGVEGTGQVLVDNLRAQFENADGTAAAFRDQMLDTYNGQKKLLKGSLETLAIVVGQPLAAVLKPILAGTVRVINGLIDAIRRMPTPVKNVIAAIVLAAGAAAAFAASVSALKGALILLPRVLGPALTTMRSFSLALGPVGLALAAVAVAIGVVVVAYRRNFGGFADAVQRATDRVGLLYRALRQLVSTGGFSGALREELAKAENSGLKRFAVTLYMVGYRVMRLGEGIRDGFVAALDAARPIFDGLRDAVAELGHELALLFGGMTEGAARLPSQEFADFGHTIGSIIGTIAAAFAALLAVEVRIVSGIVAGVQMFRGPITQAFSHVGKAIGDLIKTWDHLWGTEDASAGATGKHTSAWTKLGNVLGVLVGSSLTGLRYALTVVVKMLDYSLSALGGVIRGVMWLGSVASKVAGILRDVFGGVVTRVSGAFEHIVGYARIVVGVLQGVGTTITAILRRIAGGIREALHDVDRLVDRVKGGIGTAIDIGTGGLVAGLRGSLASDTSFAPIMSQADRTARSAASANAASAGPAVAAATAQDNLLRYALGQLRAPNPPRLAPVHIAVQVDGETIARAVHNADRDASHRSYATVASY